MKVYPIFLNNLQGRKCAVFGGNHEAERKVNGLLDCSAAVSVYSEEVTATLSTLAKEGAITWVPRWYRPGDLKDAFLAIVAITDHEATKPIWEEAKEEKVLLNAMDDVPHCTFVAGSVVEQGPLVISISTSGAAPALSVRLREEFEERFTPNYGQFLHVMRTLRPIMVTAFSDFETRRTKWYEIIDSDVLTLLEAGDEIAACEVIKELIGIGEGICMRQDGTCACVQSKPEIASFAGFNAGYNSR